MTHRYLYPHTRQIEVSMAIFAAGFGLHALYLKTMTGTSGLSWAQIENGRLVAQTLIAASLTHGLGIRANGSLGPLSPLMRAAAMAVFAGFFFGLSRAGAGSSAGFTYSAITVGMTLGMLNAAGDTIDAFKRLTTRWKA